MLAVGQQNMCCSPALCRRRSGKGSWPHLTPEAGKLYSSRGRGVGGGGGGGGGTAHCCLLCRVWRLHLTNEKKKKEEEQEEEEEEEEAEEEEEEKKKKKKEKKKPPVWC